MNAAAVAQSWVLGTTGVVSLGVAGGRVAAYRQRAEPTRAYLAVGLAAIGVAFLLNVAPVGRFVDRAAGTSNVSVVLSQVLALVDAWAAIEMVAASIGRSGGRARLARAGGFVVAAALLVLTFAAAPAWRETPVVDLFVATSHRDGWRVYWLTYAVLSLVPSLYLAMSSLRHSGVAAPWLRAGLRVVGVGAVLCGVFDALLVVAVVWPATLAMGLVQMLVVGLGCTLVALGVGLPHVPDAMSRRRLRPTWSALTALYPEVRASPRPDLRRMVTEVQDAVIAARARDELASPLICAVADLPARPADAFDETVADLVAVSQRGLSPDWDADLWTAQEVGNP